MRIRFTKDMKQQLCGIIAHERISVCFCARFGLQASVYIALVTTTLLVSCSAIERRLNPESMSSQFRQSIVYEY